MTCSPPGPRALSHALAICAAVGVCACGGPPADERVELTPGRIARGAYLVNAVTICGSCHTTRDSGHLGDPERADLPLAGGNFFESVEPRLRVWVPNITNDPDTGLGRWSDREIMTAIRDGVGRHGRALLPVMPFESYRHLSDEDVRAIVAYLRASPPIREPRPRSEGDVSFLLRAGSWIRARVQPGVHGVPPPPRGDRVKYGEYVAHAATCSDCHSLGTRGPRNQGNRYLAGSDLPMIEGGAVWAPNLTPDAATGIGGVGRDLVKRSIREPVRIDGTPMAPPMSLLTRHYAAMTDDDVDAVLDYLYAQIPIRQLVPVRRLKPEIAARLRRAQGARERPP